MWRLCGGARGIRNAGVARSICEGKPARVLEKLRAEIRYQRPENEFAFSSVRWRSSTLNSGVARICLGRRDFGTTNSSLPRLLAAGPIQRHGPLKHKETTFRCVERKIPLNSLSSSEAVPSPLNVQRGRFGDRPGRHVRAHSTRASGSTNAKAPEP